MFAIARVRLLFSVFGLTAAVASAQGPLAHGPVAGCPVGDCVTADHGPFGPALFAHGPAKRRLSLPRRLSHPLSDWRYIRQCCGPALQPGTCYGYHATRWQRWEDHCPSSNIPPAPPAQPLPPPNAPTQPSTGPREMPKVDPPKADVPKADPVAPPKLPPVPKGASATPDSLPVVRVQPPATREPGKISTAAAAPTPTPPRPVLPQTPSAPRLVVPPTPR